MLSVVGIIGAGSMGTALAQKISGEVEDVFLYGRRQEVIDSINIDRCNNHYFPSIQLRPNIHARLIRKVTDFSNCDAVIIALPSSEIRSFVSNHSNELAGKCIITTAKGLEYPSLKTMSEIISEELGNSNILCLAGPNFADEIAYGHIAGATIGISDPSQKAFASNLFDGFILDFSNDVRAVELCGILKNVYAIGVGMWDSVYSSNNEHYTFLNMCFKEMCGFLKKTSYDTEIFLKFCCFGDYILTANVDKSRNRTLGLMVGKNIIKTPYFESGVTFEGSKSVRGIIELANQNNVEMPIAKFVYDVLNGNIELSSSIHRIII